MWWSKPGTELGTLRGETRPTLQVPFQGSQTAYRNLLRRRDSQRLTWGTTKLLSGNRLWYNKGQTLIRGEDGMYRRKMKDYLWF